MAPSCVFCEIVAGRLPSTPIYEDDLTLAFLDIAPIIPGHTLVIPKPHHERLADLPLPLWRRVMEVSRGIADALAQGLKADGVNLIQADGRAAGQVVPHLHVHCIPRFVNDGHHWNWNAKRYESDEQRASTAERIRRGMRAIG